MIVSQDGRCKICGGILLGSNAHVDHCHVTGKIRGILCGPCNRGLGLFRDSVTALRQAAIYLEAASIL